MISQTIDQLASSHQGDYPKSFLVLVTVRLGLKRIESEYFDPITKCFDMPQCVGLIGGKPNFALYFVGHQDKHLIFLDPHYVQEALKDEKDL
jgi:cysteine protease ATG4